MIKYLLASALVANVSLADEYKVQTQQISDGNRFQAITIQDNTIWVSGTNSAVYKSSDNGHSWSAVNTPVTDKKLQYRDIEVIGNRVILMSAGEGSDSRIYYSADNAKNWQMVSQGNHPKTFYDCTTVVGNAIWLYGDSIDGEFFVLQSNNQGQDWSKQSLPFPAQQHEGGFAASGTCITNDDKGNVAIGTGNNEDPRVVFKNNKGKWQSISSPFAGGEAAGMFSMQFDGNNLYAFGGGLKNKDKPALAYVYNLADKTWQALPELPINGAVYGSAINQETIFVSNPNGVAALKKGEAEWRQISNLDIWAMACTQQACWGVGAKDTVIKITE